MLSLTHRAYNWRKRRAKRARGRYPLALVGFGYRVTRWQSLLLKREKVIKKKGKRK